LRSPTCHWRKRTPLRHLPRAEPVFEHFEIRIVEARIDQARGLARRRLAPAGGVVEEILAVLRVAEDERGGQENRRLEGAFGESGSKP
jgi:hypothetical protein